MENIIAIKEITKADLQFFYTTFVELTQKEFPEYPISLRYFLSHNPRGITEQTLTYLLDIGSILLGAYVHGQIVGLLIADNPYAGISFCTWIIVSHEWQRKGIGKKLLIEWEKLAKNRGAHALRLETSAKNKIFYEKLGFIPIGKDMEGYCGVDKILFKKKLQNPTLSGMLGERYP